jgi:hypothetical protein
MMMAVDVKNGEEENEKNADDTEKITAERTPACGRPPDERAADQNWGGTQIFAAQNSPLEF